MDSEKPKILRRHFGKLKRIGARMLVEQLWKLAKNGNCWFKDKRQWRTSSNIKNTKQVLQMLEKEPRGFEALICALLCGSKEARTVAYEILEDEALSDQDIDGLLNDVEGELSELQETKITLIKERKKNRKTSQEYENLKRESLISSSDRNTPEEARLLSEYGHDISTSIPDLLEELENEKKRREEAEREAVLLREKSERLEDENVQTKKELDGIKRRSMPFSDLSDYASYCEGEMDLDQDIQPSCIEGGECSSADMFDCDEGIWGKCRYASTRSPPNESNLDSETCGLNVTSGQVVETLVSKICELEDELETEKAKHYLSYSELTRLKVENENLRYSMEDIVNTLSVEDDFEVNLPEETENETENYQYIDKCCQALENVAFEPDNEQNAVARSNTLEICPPAMSIQASGTWRSLNQLHYEFDDYDNVIEKQKGGSPKDLKDALRELRQTTNILKSQVQREGLELISLRNRMKYS